MVDYKYNSNSYYENGSAARELNYDANDYNSSSAAPEITPVIRREHEHRKNKTDLRKKLIADRNKQRALAMTPGYVAFLAIMILVVGVTSVIYVKLQTDANLYTNRIATLKSEVERISADNVAAEKRISTEIEMDKIKSKALKKGMNYPKEDQIIYYSLDTADYMNQYYSVN